MTNRRAWTKSTHQREFTENLSFLIFTSLSCVSVVFWVFHSTQLKQLKRLIYIQWKLLSFSKFSSLCLFAENLLKVNFFWFRVCEITIEKNIRGNLQFSIANFLMYKLNENFIQVLCVGCLDLVRPSAYAPHYFFPWWKAKEISFEIFVTIFFLVCWFKREKCRNIIFIISKECRTSFFHKIFVVKKCGKPSE